MSLETRQLHCSVLQDDRVNVSREENAASREKEVEVNSSNIARYTRQIHYTMTLFLSAPSIIPTILAIQDTTPAYQRRG